MHLRSHGVSSYRMESPNSVPHPAPEAEEVYRRWIQFLDDEFIRHSSPERRAEIVRDQLYQLYLGRPHGGKLEPDADLASCPATCSALSLDPDNVTLEAEHFADADRERYARRKPLLWFWQMFDRSPIGLNHWLGLRFRCMLGRHIFDAPGRGRQDLSRRRSDLRLQPVHRGRRDHSPATRCSTTAAASPSARAR